MLWALDSTPDASKTETLQKEYTLGQNKIDLALTEIALEVANGIVTGEEGQEKTDRWMIDNKQLLVEQARRAEELDGLVPLPPDPVVNAGEESPEEGRLRELVGLEEERIRSLRAESQSGEDFQEKFDAWFLSEEGKAIFAEKASIFAKMPHHQPLGTQPVVIGYAENSSPVEMAVVDVEERIARRIQEIRKLNPQADPVEMQRLIDEAKEDFDRNNFEMANLLEEVKKARLAAEVAKLRSQIGLAEALSPEPISK